MKGYLRSLALVAFFVGLTAVSGFASAANIYIAQNPVGSANGTSCADAYGVNFFNSAGDWGIGTAQIGPGTTVHLCGTFTGGPGSTMLTVQGSGASGSPITIKFEPGAILTAPYWSGSSGAINLNSQSYIVVDGGTNGVIENTANGTGLAYHQTSVGVFADGTSNCEVKNLAITNLYVHTLDTDTAVNAQVVSVVLFRRAPNMVVDNNTFHDCGWCVNGYGNNDQIYKNDIYNMAGGVVVGVAGTISGMKIYNNHFHDMLNWNTTNDAYHKDAIHLWGESGGVIDRMQIYNNVFDGDPGDDLTALLTLEQSIQNTSVFNNVFVYPGHNLTAEGIVYVWASPGTPNVDGDAFYNNTFINDNPSTVGMINMYVSNHTNFTYRNNVTVGANDNIFILNTTLGSMDNNVYEDTSSEYGTRNAFNWNNTPYGTLSAWQSACGCDSNAIAATASQINLAGNGSLNAGSVAIGAGANLTSLGITALDYDKMGVQRSSSGAWDAGAFAYGSSASGPPPPSGLTAAAH